MLSVEQEPIRLPKILNEVDGSTGRNVSFSNGKHIFVPRRFLFLWDQIKIGASIYDLSLRLRVRGESSRVFLEVAAFLCFLVDHDLIDDLRIVQMADSIRGEYQWPTDVFSSLSVSVSLFSWPRKKQNKIPVYSRTYDFLSTLLVLLSIPFLLMLATHFFEASELSSIDFGTFLIGGILLGGTIGRTGTSVLRSCASIIAGDSGELQLRVDFLGPHLGFDPQTVTGAFRRAVDFGMCYGTATLPLMIVLIARFSFPDILVSAWSVTLLGVLFTIAISSHPLTKSMLTSSLRVWNRTPLNWREEEELREVEAFQRIGGFLSVLVAAIFFCTLLVGVLKVHPDVHFIRSHIYQFLLFFTAFAISTYAYTEPFFLNTFSSFAPRNRRRRLWATRYKVLSVASADREVWNELPVLRQLTAPLRRRLIENARVVEYAPGKAVCRQGENSRSLYIVLEGELAVAKSFGDKRRKIVAILGKGSVFGETAFFFGSHRTADVVAMEKCSLLEIPYQSIMQDLDLTSSDEFQFRVWLLQALSGNSMFKELPSEAMDTLIFAGARKTFRAGEVVFTEGSPANTCYFIAQGRASVMQGGRKVNEVGAGEAFGEIALLRTGSRRTASVVADSDLLCMELDVDSFWALLAARLPLGAEIERLALRRLRDDQARLRRER